jgi:hypothetical protein
MNCIFMCCVVKVISITIKPLCKRIDGVSFSADGFKFSIGKYYEI